MASLTGGSGEEGTFGEICSLGRKIIFTKLQRLRYTTKKKTFKANQYQTPSFSIPRPLPSWLLPKFRGDPTSLRLKQICTRAVLGRCRVERGGN